MGHIKPVISPVEAMQYIKSGSTLMVGGFMTTGSPDRVLRELEKESRDGITLIANDAAVPGHSKGRLVTSGMIDRIIASHVGLNPEVGIRMKEETLEAELVPQGTLIERIRCGGNGLGGVLTPTGIGTIVEEGKQKITVDGSEYLLETALRADVAILYGTRADKKGNVFLEGATLNFNQQMAMAADLVLVEPEEIVETGELPPHSIHIPHIFVDYLVTPEEQNG